MLARLKFGSRSVSMLLQLQLGTCELFRHGSAP
jgi:hypothetical protein